jgi:hypothetical protein
MTSTSPRARFGLNFAVDVKDATAANNLMGEGLYGTTGPTAAAGQSPFLSGAFGPACLPTFLPGIVQPLLLPLTIADLIFVHPRCLRLICHT